MNKSKIKALCKNHILQISEQKLLLQSNPLQIAMVNKKKRKM